MSAVRLRLTESVPGARLLGLGSFQPDRVVTNDELAARVETSDEWIRSRVGIESRRIADKDTQLVDMAADAGARALKDSGLEPADDRRGHRRHLHDARQHPERRGPGRAPASGSRRRPPSTSTPRARASATGSPSRRTSSGRARSGTSS